MTIYGRKLLLILAKIFRKRIKLFTQNEEIWGNLVIGGSNNPSELRARPVQWGWRLRRVPFHSSFIIFLTRDFFVNYLYHKCFSGHLKWFANNRVCQKEINPDHKRSEWRNVVSRNYYGCCHNIYCHRTLHQIFRTSISYGKHFCFSYHILLHFKNIPFIKKYFFVVSKKISFSFLRKDR